MKKGAQGVVFVVKDTKTQQQYALKSVIIESAKKKEFEKMIETWKILCKSDAKDFIVSYVEHFYEEENAGFASVCICF
jgi:serine/threonine protein kinase